MVKFVGAEQKVAKLVLKEVGCVSKTKNKKQEAIPKSKKKQKTRGKI